MSPPAGFYHSPSNTNLNRRSRRFFEESDPRRRSRDSEGGVLGTAIPAASGQLPKHHGGDGSNGKNSATSTEDIVMDDMNLSKIRNLAKTALQSSTTTASPEIAVFYASILYSKTQSLEDAFFYAQSLIENKETKRAVMILERAGLLGTEGTLLQRVEATLLAAQALCETNGWQEASQLLEDVCISGGTTAWLNSSLLEDSDEEGWKEFSQSVAVGLDAIHPVARLCYWRGRCYDETSHPPRALIFWKRALLMDPKCVQAFDSLLNRNLLTAQEAHNLVATLKMDTELQWLRRIYLARIHLAPSGVASEFHDREPTVPFMSTDASVIHTTTPSVTQMDDFSENLFADDRKMPPVALLQQQARTALEELWTINNLHNSPEVLSFAAIRAYRSYDLQAAFDYCQELSAVDPLCQTASFVHVATLLSLNHKRLLFGLGHEWVEASPQSARSWFAVGCYYYACGRFHVAQQHFCRATRLDPLCSEAWIAFGCSFAACDESDQALAAFRAAQRLAPAEPAAMLYMGMEYVRTNHLVLAQHSLLSALNSSGGDPLCLHELGVVAFHKKEWDTAIDWYSRALHAVAYTEGQDAGTSTLENVDLIQSEFWEPTLFNLGHCYRKTRKFKAAISCFEKCLVLIPGSASALSALGFTNHLNGDFDGAIDMYHQSLSRQPDDPFSSEMLNRALQEAIAVKLVIQSPRPEREIRTPRRL